MFQNINVLHFPIVSYVPMWLICFIRALIYKKYDILPVTWATSVFFLLK